MYKAIVLDEAFNKNSYQKRLAQVPEELRLHTARSLVGNLFNSGDITVILLAKKLEAVYRSKSNIGKETAAKEDRRHVLCNTAEFWKQDFKQMNGRLIPEIKPCIHKKHGEVL